MLPLLTGIIIAMLYAGVISEQFDYLNIKNKSRKKLLNIILISLLLVISNVIVINYFLTDTSIIYNFGEIFKIWFILNFIDIIILSLFLYIKEKVDILNAIRFSFKVLFYPVILIGYIVSAVLVIYAFLPVHLFITLLAPLAFEDIRIALPPLAAYLFGGFLLSLIIYYLGMSKVIKILLEMIKDFTIILIFILLLALLILFPLAPLIVPTLVSLIILLIILFIIEDVIDSIGIQGLVGLIIIFLSIIVEFKFAGIIEKAIDLISNISAISEELTGGGNAFTYFLGSIGGVLYHMATILHSASIALLISGVILIYYGVIRREEVLEIENKLLAYSIIIGLIFTLFINIFNFNLSNLDGFVYTIFKILIGFISIDISSNSSIEMASFVMVRFPAAIVVIYTFLIILNKFINMIIRFTVVELPEWSQYLYPLGVILGSFMLSYYVFEHQVEIYNKILPIHFIVFSFPLLVIILLISSITKTNKLNGKPQHYEIPPKSPHLESSSPPNVSPQPVASQENRLRVISRDGKFKMEISYSSSSPSESFGDVVRDFGLKVLEDCMNTLKSGRSLAVIKQCIDAVILLYVAQKISKGVEINEEIVSDDIIEMMREDPRFSDVLSAIEKCWQDECDRQELAMIVEKLEKLASNLG